MSKETFYFSHDYNARSDEKVIELLSRHGMEGYGIFWGIVESLYNNTNVLRTNYDRIAYDLHTESKIVESVVNDFGLFSIKDGFFGSVSIERRLNERNDKSAKARKSVSKRWEKYERNTNVSENDTNVPKTDTIKERKVKERILKDSRGKKSAFIPPTIDEVKNFFAEKGYCEQAAIKAFNHYDLDQWHDVKGKPVQNWRRKMNDVWFKPENKISDDKPMMP